MVLCCGGYNNHNSNIPGYLKAQDNCLDIFIKNYENLLIEYWVILTLNPMTRTWKLAARLFKLKHLVKVPTCFKKSD